MTSSITIVGHEVPVCMKRYVVFLFVPASGVQSTRRTSELTTRKLALVKSSVQELELNIQLLGDAAVKPSD